MRSPRITIRITLDGKVYPLENDVATEHPAEVHKALGTTSEAELQWHLDQCHVDDWYDDWGDHRGPDVDGLEMFYDHEEAP